MVGNKRQRPAFRQEEDLMTNSALSDAWQLVELGHAVYATRDGRYEVRRGGATAADREWVVLEHPEGDDDPVKTRLYFVKSLSGAATLIERRYRQPPGEDEPSSL